MNNITYEQFKNFNDTVRKGFKGNPFCKALKIDKVDFSKNTCEIQGKTYKIKEIVCFILERKGCISNPSILTNWKGFNIENKSESNKTQKYTRVAIERKLKDNFSKYTYLGVLLDTIVVIKLDDQFGVFDLQTERYVKLQDFSNYTQASAFKTVIVNNILVSYTQQGTLKLYRFKNIDDIATKIINIEANKVSIKCSVLCALTDRFILITGYAYTAILDIETAMVYIDNNYYISILYEDSSDSDFKLKVDSVACNIKENSIVITTRISSEFIRSYTKYKWPMKKGYKIQFGMFMDGRPLQVVFYNDKKQKTEHYYCKDYKEMIKIEKKG